MDYSIWDALQPLVYRQKIKEHWPSKTSLHKEYLTGWPQSRWKKFPEFSRLFQSHKLTFPSVITTKSKRNNDLSSRVIPHQLQQYEINWAGSLLPEILFTQSTSVLHKYLNDELKILCLLQFFPEVAQNSMRIPWVFNVHRNPRVFQVFQVWSIVLNWQ